MSQPLLEFREVNVYYGQNPGAEVGIANGQ